MSGCSVTVTRGWVHIHATVTTDHALCERTTQQTQRPDRTFASLDVSKRLYDDLVIGCSGRSDPQTCGAGRCSRARAASRSPADVRALLGALEVLSDEVETLVSLATEDRQPGWWRQYAEVLPAWFEGYLSLESEASRLLSYESEVVPGLLQTEDYAAEILRHSPGTIRCTSTRLSTRERSAG